MRILIVSCLFFVLAPAVFAETGKASFYTEACAGGGKTANGERYDEDAFTAAHRTLPFGTLVRVINRDNGRSVVVRINDRGPYVRGRVIDLSKAAFAKIASRKDGVVRVVIERIDPDHCSSCSSSANQVVQVVKEEVSREQGVSAALVDLKNQLGQDYRTIVLYCCSRLNRKPNDLVDVSDRTTVEELIKALEV